MESSTVLSRSSLPLTGSPSHHKSVATEVANINAILEQSGLNDEEKRSLVESINKVAKVCVKDAVERTSP